MDFASRLDSIVAAHPTVIIIFGSRSDVYVSSQTVYTAAQSFYAALRAKLPKTPIVVIARIPAAALHPAQQVIFDQRRQ